MRKRTNAISYLLRIRWGKKPFTNEQYKQILIENLLAKAEDKTTTQFIINLAENINFQNGISEDKDLAWALQQILTLERNNEPAGVEEVDDIVCKVLGELTSEKQKISFPEISSKNKED